MLLMTFFLSLIIVGVLMIIFAIFSQIKQNKPIQKSPSNNALSILEERFAKGEISRDEFLKDKKLLVENK